MKITCIPFLLLYFSFAVAQQIENENEFVYYIANVQPSQIKSMGKGKFEFRYDLKKFKNPNWYPSWARDDYEDGIAYIPNKGEVRAYLDSIPNQVKLLVDMAPCKLSIDCFPSYDGLGPVPLVSSFASCSKKDFLPSVDQLLWRGKFSDDGIMAAFEYYDEFLRKSIPRSEFYDKVCNAALKKIDSPKMVGLGARVLLGKLWTARTLGGDSLVPEIKRNQEIYDRIREETAYMNKKKSIWKPIGFYTWTRQLSSIYSRDRILQQPFLHHGVEAMLVLFAILEEDTLLKKAYFDDLNRFALLNGVPKFDFAKEIDSAGKISGFIEVLDDSIALRNLQMRLEMKKMTFIPSAYTPEDRFLDSKSGDGDGEEGIMDPFVGAIAKGKVDLTPGTNGSWYEYQQYALEPLLLFSDRAKINRLHGYIEKLKMTFASLYAAHRETHALGGYGIGYGGDEGNYFNKIALMIKPVCRIEPLPEVYLRTSTAYDRLAAIMKTKYNEVPFKGMRPDSTNVLTYAFEEVSYLSDLYYGFYLVSCEDIGMQPQKTSKDQKTLAALAEDFLFKISTDNDLKQDIRFMLPITSITDNPESNSPWFWVVDGIDTVNTISIEFDEDPGVDFGAVKPEHFTLVRTGLNKKVAKADFFEISLPANKTRNRSEFRKLADKAGRVQDKIRDALIKGN